MIILTNKTLTRNKEFKIKGNLIYYSSTKSKRVIRSTLALEIYSIVGGVNIAITINTTIKIIIEQLDSLYTLIVAYIDLYSLYKCLVKLSTTKEKRLIIDIIVL